MSREKFDGIVTDFTERMYPAKRGQESENGTTELETTLEHQDRSSASKDEKLKEEDVANVSGLSLNQLKNVLANRDSTVSDVNAAIDELITRGVFDRDGDILTFSSESSKGSYAFAKQVSKLVGNRALPYYFKFEQTQSPLSEKVYMVPSMEAKSKKVIEKDFSSYTEKSKVDFDKSEAREVQLDPRVEKANAAIASAREKIKVIEEYKQRLRDADIFSDAILEVERQKAELLGQELSDEEEFARIEKKTELSLQIIDLMRQQGQNQVEYQELLEAEEAANEDLAKALKDLEDAEIDQALEAIGKADIQHNYTDKEIMAIATNPNVSLAVLLGLTKGLTRESVDRIKEFIEQGKKQEAVDVVRDELYTRFFTGQESANTEENYKKALSSEPSLVELLKMLESEDLRQEVIIALKNGVISISTDGEIVSSLENAESNVDYVEDLKERVLNTFREKYHKEIFTTLVDDFKRSDKLYLVASGKIKELRDKIRGQEAFVGRSEKVKLYLFDRGRFEELSQVQKVESEIQRLTDLREIYLRRHKDMFEKTADFRLEMFEKVSEDEFGLEDAFEYRAYAKELISEEKILGEDDSVYIKEFGLSIEQEKTEVKAPYLISQLAEKFTNTEKINIAKKYVEEIKSFIQANSDIILSDQEFESFLIRSSTFEDLQELAVLAEGIPKFLQEHTDSHNFSNETVRFALTELIQTKTSLDALKTVILREFASEWGKTRFDLLVDKGVFMQEFIKGFDFPQEEQVEVQAEAQQIIEETRNEVANEVVSAINNIKTPREPSYDGEGSSDYDSIPVRSNRYTNLNATTEGLNTTRSQKTRKKSVWASLFEGLFSLFGGGKN